MPVEIMLLPRWFPFHLTKVSYWARTVLVPLLVLCALKPRARNPRGVTHRRTVRAAAARRSARPRRRRTRTRRWFALLPRRRHRAAQEPSPFRRRNCANARSTRRVDFVTERLNGEDGLGAIFPAMANAVMMFDVLGYPRTIRAASSRATRSKAARHQGRRGLLPALRVAGVGHGARRARAARSRHARRRSRLRAGARLAEAAAGARRRGRLDRARAGRAARRLGVPVRQSALSRSRRHRGRRDGDGPRRRSQRRRQALRRRDRARREWVRGMQSRNGGWGAFDADNTYDYLNNIPFADHGALLDPPTEDVDGALRLDAGAARRQAGRSERCKRGIDYLLARAARRTAAGTAAGA